MSLQNVELVRQIYAWFAAGESEKPFELYDENIEWNSTGAPWLIELGFAGVVWGHDAVREGFRSWLEAWEAIRYEADELLDAGDSVLAMTRVSARGRASGVELMYETPQLWTFRDGKVIRMRVFSDRDEALAAAGLAAD
jgi:ketosteroid isomerase-like protein